MTTNLGVKALLSWVNSMKLSDRKISIEDLQDGAVLLRLVDMLKKEPNSHLTESVEDRFRLISDFVERDCRFSAAKGTSLSWDNIRHGIDLTVEIAKVLLLLVYHDMMNDRCTLNMLDCEVERELANLTSSYVMESEGCVYLSNGLVAYLTRRYLPVSRDIFERSATTSTSNLSSMSSFSDDDSPVFRRTQKIAFVDMQTVASSSVSKSPLEDIMNTPKFQIRKMQRQMIKERDYRDDLERELATKVTLIAQRESHINQLQYRLDKLKEERGDQEQAIRQQINELETKNERLQMRLNEMLKQNKDLKSTTSVLERQVDELAEENGTLSSRMRAVCSQLAIFEAEVGRLTETQASAQEEWISKESHLQAQLNQASAQKDILAEQIQILQGKISCLEDEIKKTAMEEAGENMGPVMEREMLENEISGLKDELESTLCFLKKAEVEIQAKTQQLTEYQHEISQHKDLLEQQKRQADEMIQVRDELLEKLQKELAEQRVILQQEIQELKLKLQIAEQQKTEEIIKLQQHIAACEQEIEKLKEIKKAKEDLLHQTEESVKDLEIRLSVATSLLTEKEQQINGLKEEVDLLTDETKKGKDQIQAKDEELAKLLLEKSNEQEILQNKIQNITAHVEDLGTSLKQAKQEIQIKQDLLAKTQQETIQQREVFQQEISTHEAEVQKLNAEIQVKNEQLLMLKNTTSQQSESLGQEIKDLNSQVESLTDSLGKAEEQVLTQQAMLTQQQQDSAYQKDLLQQQLSASEEMIRSMKEEIQTKEKQLNLLKNQSSEQEEMLHQEIKELNKQVEGLGSSLKSAEENLQSKEILLAEQHLQSTQHIEALRMQMVASEAEVKRLNKEIHTKEEQLVQLKTEMSTHVAQLQQEIDGLNQQIKSMDSSLETAKEQCQAKEDMIAKHEQESNLQIEELRNHSEVLEKEVNQLMLQIQAKQDEVDMLKVDSCKESEVLQNEIQTLRDQVQHLNKSLKTATEQVQAKENLLAQRESEISQEKETLQNMKIMSEEERGKLRDEIQAKEEQLTSLKRESSTHTDMLQQEIKSLKSQLDHMADALRTAEENVQTHLALLNRQEQESVQQKELLQQQLSASKEEVRKMKNEIQTKEEQVALLKTDNIEQSGMLHQEIQSLKKQVESLDSSLKKAGEDIQSKEYMLSQQCQENAQQREVLQILQEKVQQVEILQNQVNSREEEIKNLKESQSEKESLLLKAEDKLQTLQTELVDAKTLLADRDQNLNTLREEVIAQANFLQKAKEEAEAREQNLAEIKDAGAKQTEVLQLQIQNLKLEIEAISLELVAKKQKLHEIQEESGQQMHLLQQQLESVNADLNQHKETKAENIRLKEALYELKINKLTLEKQVETIVFEKEQLAKAHQALEKGNKASCKLETMLQRELEILKMENDKLLKEMEKSKEIELLNRDLQERLSAKSEAAEHYKIQMEKAASHYNTKKELLQKSQKEVDELKRFLEAKEREVRDINMDKKILQFDLEKVQANEKKLSNRVASLEAQLACADKSLRVQNKIYGNGGSTSGSCYFEVPNTRSSIYTKASVKRTMSSDSLDQSSLEDSLNSTRKLSAPDESSTPLHTTRSSERLAAKRRGLQAESLETLYFTPINSRQTNRTITENNMELDSARKNPTSSVKRRRTTQVINITMTKKTPGCNEGDETFYSLASARSQPNLSSAHSAQPVSVALFDTPAKMSSSSSDQLAGLPGLRRSTIHSQATRTFCVGAENEPDGAPDDWMRIAELQSRNRACLPHLKSSYPVESETGCGGALAFTDEELRTGDPSDTVRRASMMPGQLQDSLVSHRHSLMLGQAAGSRSHRLSLMPGQLSSKTSSSSQLRSPKGMKRSTSTLSVHQYSPETKIKASCFPRPLTPKNKNVNTRSSSSQLHPTHSPAAQQQSMTFTIENTPNNKDSFLHKRLNKLRSSSRKSPGKSTKKSPAHTSARKCQENKPPGSSRAAVARAGRASNFKSPQVSAKGLRKSPHATSRSAKSPGLTASARKMIRKMKI